MKKQPFLALKTREISSRKGVKTTSVKVGEEGFMRQVGPRFTTRKKWGTLQERKVYYASFPEGLLFSPVVTPKPLLKEKY